MNDVNTYYIEGEIVYEKQKDLTLKARRSLAFYYRKSKGEKKEIFRNKNLILQFILGSTVVRVLYKILWNEVIDFTSIDPKLLDKTGESLWYALGEYKDGRQKKLEEWYFVPDDTTSENPMLWMLTNLEETGRIPENIVTE